MSERGPGRKPDLVDRAALAKRLEVSASTVWRWQRRRVLPKPDVVLDGTELWLWDTMREWARHPGRLRKRQQAAPAEVAEIIHAGELAERLGVDTRTVAVWQARGSLPKPDYRWDGIDGWLGETIDEWAKTRLWGRTAGAASPAESAPPEVPAASPQLRVTAAVSAFLGPLKPIRPVQEQPAPPAAVPVTRTRKRSDDPVGDLDRLQRYFADLARTLRDPSLHH
ncbi:MAG: hypothetical protein OEP52_02055 [Acidimicrobiia bacterium]|nr:hypothetical protein [Acidimicrobiia bacterium]